MQGPVTRFTSDEGVHYPSLSTHVLTTPLVAYLCVENVINDVLILPITEAEAATEANVYAVVVDRPGNAPLSDESKAKFPVIQKLTDVP
jgi:hypothetical protein